MRKKLALFICLLLIPLASDAQLRDRLTNPEIEVTLTHPPQLPITTERVAFGRSYGRCSEQLVEALIEIFLSRGVEVVDRNNFDTVLAEHDYVLDDYVDRATAFELGRILGPSALIVVNGQRCSTRQSNFHQRRTTVTGQVQVVFVARVEAIVRASLRVVDLATGRIFAAKTLEASHFADNHSFSGWPQFPSPTDALDGALAKTTAQAYRVFFPWQEQRSLVFYNDKKCNLKVAYDLLKVGQVEAVAEQSRRNLELCRATPGVKSRTLAHAHYNLAVASFLLNDHQAALDSFEDSQRIRPAEITSEAIAEARRARALILEGERVEESMSLGARTARARGPSSAESPESDEAATDEQQAGDRDLDDSIGERLRQLDQLLGQGLISKDEYEQKRAEILADL